MAARPGRVSVDCSAIDARPDAAEAFAVSWSGLFDGHLWPRRVVSLEERRSAGPQLVAAVAGGASTPRSSRAGAAGSRSAGRRSRSSPRSRRGSAWRPWS